MTAPFDPIRAAYRRSVPAMENPPVAATTEGMHISLGVNARAPYLSGAIPATASVRPPEGQQRRKGRKRRLITFCDSTGRVWGFDGKRGRVLAMLATMGQGGRATGLVAGSSKFGGIAVQLAALVGLIPTLGGAALALLLPTAVSVLTLAYTGRETTASKLAKAEEPTDGT